MSTAPQLAAVATTAPELAPATRSASEALATALEAIAVALRATEQLEAKLEDLSREQLIDVEAVARMLDVDRSFAGKLLRRGVIPRVELGKHAVRARLADVNAYIRRQAKARPVKI